jgi:hypothetical protein
MVVVVVVMELRLANPFRVVSSSQRKGLRRPDNINNTNSNDIAMVPSKGYQESVPRSVGSLGTLIA